MRSPHWVASSSRVWMPPGLSSHGLGAGSQLQHALGVAASRWVLMTIPLGRELGLPGPGRDRRGTELGGLRSSSQLGGRRVSAVTLQAPGHLWLERAAAHAASSTCSGPRRRGAQPRMRRGVPTQKHLEVSVLVPPVHRTGLCCPGVHRVQELSRQHHFVPGHGLQSQCWSGV